MKSLMVTPRGPCRPSNLAKALHAATRAILDEAVPAADERRGPTSVTGSRPAISDLEAALAKVEGEHLLALQWFQRQAGKIVSWAEITDHADSGARLVTQAKGIYKPHYTDFALSVRQTLDMA
jgi:hypothetical protein